MRYVLTDLDHVVCDASWRDHMIGTLSWDEYHAAGEADEPNAAVVAILHAFRVHHLATVVGITARPEKWRIASLRWMLDNNVPMDELLMRPDLDHRPSPVVKVDLIQNRFPVLDEIAFVLEDREDVCAAYRAMGLTVLQVHAGQSRATKELVNKLEEEANAK
jgi:hypothetical protein